MKKTLFILYIILVLRGFTAFSQTAADSALLLPDKDMQSWRNAKFGLFIHFGLYALEGKGEWAMFNQRIPFEEYSQLKNEFYCEKFRGADWVNAARDAGCKYMVVTAKHHDGFCLFDTRFGDYDAVNSAAGRDLYTEYADAVHKAGLMMGIYYSPLDWRYPGFFFPDLYRASAEEMKRQTYAQVRELLTNYGKVDILWYDGGEDNWLGFGGLEWGNGWHQRSKDKPYTGKFSWEPLRLNAMVRELQPKIVINPRSGWMGDFETQEGKLKGKISDRPWELCTNLSRGAWGWTPQAKDRILSLDSCIRLLVTVVCQDGNLLVNVGPKPNGEIEPAQVHRLKEIGAFLGKYGESIYNTRGGTFDSSWGGTTETDKAVYVHILKVPSNGRILVPGVTRAIASAYFMNNHKKVNYIQNANQLELNELPGDAGETDIVVKMIYK